MIKTASILNDIQLNDTAPVFSVMLDNNAVREVRIACKAGQLLAEHSAAHPIVVAVIEGEIDFTVESVNYNLNKGMMIALEANVLHQFKAVTDSLVRLSIHKSS